VTVVSEIYRDLEAYYEEDAQSWLLLLTGGEDA
jgi:hypothetical protein